MGLEEEQAQHMKVRFLLLLMIGLSLTAQGGPLTWESLRYAKDDADGRHLRALLKTLPELTKGWQHYPLRDGGNFLSEGWIQGKGNVLNEAFMETAGVGWYSVQALHYKLPDVFGCLLQAGRNPQRDGLGVRFWYCSGGRTVVSDGADLDFAVWQKGKIASRLPVLRPSLDIPEQYDAEMAEVKTDWRADLAALADPTAFRDSTLKRYDTTATRFRRALAEGKVKRRKYREYQGGGIPPEGYLVPLTDSESAELRRFVDTKVGDWKKGLEEHHAAMHALFLEVVPLTALTN